MKVLLAHLPPDRAEQIIGRGLPRLPRDRIASVAGRVGRTADAISKGLGARPAAPRSGDGRK